MEIFKNPKNVGEVENYNAIGTVGNATCGDIMQITLRIEDGIIKDAKFKTFGCAAAITSSSALFIYVACLVSSSTSKVGDMPSLSKFSLMSD